MEKHHRAMPRATTDSLDNGDAHSDDSKKVIEGKTILFLNLNVGSVRLGEGGHDQRLRAD